MYMSGYMDDVIDEQDVLKQNALFIQKPFSPTELLYTIRGLLDRRSPTKTNS